MAEAFEGSVAITGASGFVGRHLTVALGRAGISVLPLSRTPLDVPGWRSSPVLGEADATAWAEALTGAAAVVHCAARAHVMREREQDPLAVFRRINRDGAIAMAEGAALAGVRRIVFISTVKVLGETTEGRAPFRNVDPPAPEDPYAISKAEAEAALAAIAEARGIELVVLRPPLVYGPGVGGNIAALIRKIRAGWLLPFGGARRNRRSMISTDNLAGAIRAALFAPARPGSRYLVSDGEDISTRALIEALAKAAGRPARLVDLSPALLRPLFRLSGRASLWTRLFGDLRVEIAESCARLAWQPCGSTITNLERLSQDVRDA